jgi:Tfp pilus assembly protein PilV
MCRARSSPLIRRAAHGAALLEALVALLIVSLLSALLLNEQQALRQARTAARQRLDALQLARLEFARLRSSAASSPATPAAPPFTLSSGEAGDASALHDLSVAVD